MKWPETLTIVRHGESAYNELRGLKENDPLYQEFKTAYDNQEDSERILELAKQVMAVGQFVLKVGDHNTALTERGQHQAEVTGNKLSHRIDLPDVVLVSPYDRTRDTLHHMAKGWPELGQVKTIEDDRLREQEHGLALLYSDWRIFQTLHPEQKALREAQGPYWYRFPQGENVPDVRDRVRSITDKIVRDWSEQRVLLVVHHLFLLGFRANFEDLGEAGFIDLDEHDKPINCGATIYRGNPAEGQDGHLELEVYNQRLY